MLDRDPSGSTRPHRCRRTRWLRGLHRTPREGPTVTASTDRRKREPFSAPRSHSSCGPPRPARRVQRRVLRDPPRAPAESLRQGRGRHARRLGQGRHTEAPGGHGSQSAGLRRDDPRSPAFIRFLDNAPAVMKGIEAVGSPGGRRLQEARRHGRGGGSQAVLTALGVPLARRDRSRRCRSPSCRSTS